MEYTHLGRTGLQVSRLCLGTMNFGPETTEEDSCAIMDRALDAGINFFDTANVYGWKQGEGVTEQIIGRWFAQGGGRREKIVLATKVYGVDGRLAERRPSSRRCNIRRACDDSPAPAADRPHRPLPDAPRRPRHARGTRSGRRWTCSSQQGKVLYVGSSQLRRLAHRRRPTRPPRGAALARAGQRAELYNLLDAHDRARGAAGLPRLRPRRDPVEPARRRAARRRRCARRSEGRSAGEQQRRAARAAPRRSSRSTRSSATSSASEPADVALAWLLHQPGVTGPIIGPRTLEQLEQSLRALEIELDEKALERLDEIFPGPGGPAPEAYAW